MQEAARTCSVSADIAANLAEYGLMSLFAPVQRVTGYDTIMPYFRLENQYMPSTERVIAAVKKTMEAS